MNYSNTTIEEYVYEIWKEHDNTLNGWQDFFENEDVRAEIIQISNEIDKIVHESNPETIIYPPLEYVFYAFMLIPMDQIKVIILGQDPYHSNEGEAMGLAFSVPKNIRIPPSLANIYKVLQADGLITEKPKHGRITKWSKRGVFLINTALTVKAKNPNSHKKIWENFTKILLNYLNENISEQQVAVLLWGSPAQKLGQIFSGILAENYDEKDPPNPITRGFYKIICTHPSPLSAYKASSSCESFMKSKCFLSCNQYLLACNKSEINWKI